MRPNSQSAKTFLCISEAMHGQFCSSFTFRVTRGCSLAELSEVIEINSDFLSLSFFLRELQEKPSHLAA